MANHYITLGELHELPQEVKDEIAAMLRRAQEIFKTKDVTFKVNRDAYLKAMQAVGPAAVDEVWTNDSTPPSM